MLDLTRGKVEMFSPRVIHIFGASGAGTSTLGRAIADKYGYTQLDTDDYFWVATDPKFTTKRGREERLLLMARDIETANKCVISGAFCGWGDVFIPQLELAIFVYTKSELRLKRLKEREYRLFGDRILNGGDMHEENVEFLAWASKYDTAGMEMRSLTEHKEWMKKLSCPIFSLDGEKPTDELLKELNQNGIQFA